MAILKVRNIVFFLSSQKQNHSFWYHFMQPSVLYVRTQISLGCFDTDTAVVQTSDSMRCFKLI